MTMAHGGTFSGRSVPTPPSTPDFNSSTQPSSGRAFFQPKFEREKQQQSTCESADVEYLEPVNGIHKKRSASTQVKPVSTGLNFPKTPCTRSTSLSTEPSRDESDVTKRPTVATSIQRPKITAPSPSMARRKNSTIYEEEESDNDYEDPVECLPTTMPGRTHQQGGRSPPNKSSGPSTLSGNGPAPPVPSSHRNTVIESRSVVGSSGTSSDEDNVYEELEVKEPECQELKAKKITSVGMLGKDEDDNDTGINSEILQNAMKILKKVPKYRPDWFAQDRPSAVPQHEESDNNQIAKANLITDLDNTIGVPSKNKTKPEVISTPSKNDNFTDDRLKAVGTATGGGAKRVVDSSAVNGTSIGSENCKPVGSNAYDIVKDPIRTRVPAGYENVMPLRLPDLQPSRTPPATSVSSEKHSGRKPGKCTEIKETTFQLMSVVPSTNENETRRQLANENETRRHLANENETRRHLANENETRRHLANENETRRHLANENETRRHPTNGVQCMTPNAAMRHQTTAAVSDTPKSCLWYFGAISREDSERILKPFLSTNGTFIVRISSRGDPLYPYAISVVFNKFVYNVQIRKRPDNKYSLGIEKPDQKVFSTVQEMVAFYTNNSLELMSSGKPAGKVCLKEPPPTYMKDN